VPSPLSVTAPREPLSLERTTTSPPADRALPAASLRVTVTVELPPTAIEAGTALIVEVAAEATPGRPTTTVAVLTRGTPVQGAAHRHGPGGVGREDRAVGVVAVVG